MPTKVCKREYCIRRSLGAWGTQISDNVMDIVHFEFDAILSLDHRAKAIQYDTILATLLFHNGLGAMRNGEDFLELGFPLSIHGIQSCGYRANF